MIFTDVNSVLKSPRYKNSLFWRFSVLNVLNFQDFPFPYFKNNPLKEFLILSYYSGRKADRVKGSEALSIFLFLFGVAMGREIRLRATSYCSRSRFLYSTGTSYVFCRVIFFIKFSVAFFFVGPWIVFTICEPDVQSMNKTCEAWTTPT